MAVWWSERPSMGKKRGDEGHMWGSACIPNDHIDMHPVQQVSDQNRFITKRYKAHSLCLFPYVFLHITFKFDILVAQSAKNS